jgi:hypothetical protein
MADGHDRGKAGQPVKTMNALLPASPRQHHSSHLALLRRAASAELGGSSPVDAIVVPTARDTTHLRTAMRLAEYLNCPLLALCSLQATVADTVLLAKELDIAVVAIDTGYITTELVPPSASTELLRRAGFASDQDTSVKRNLALLLANLMEWRRIVFLDDDIEVPDPRDLGRAAHLLDQYEAVGLSIGAFPDNSVVCHAHRATGGDQRTFIGGGALAVGPELMSSFFPNVYNEDWFFLLDGNQLCPATLVGSAVQRRYDPYANVLRAESEEFGDCLAEGVFALLDQGQRVDDAMTDDYWANYLGVRRTFIEDVIRRVEADEKLADTSRMVEALTAARERSQLIEPSLCVAHLAAWRQDREQWRKHVGGHQDRLSWITQRGAARMEMVLSALGLLT